MTWDLPDDWGAYYRTCEVCGKTYHQSGVVECGCEECADCGNRFLPDDLENGLCESCQPDPPTECPDCGDEVEDNPDTEVKRDGKWVTLCANRHEDCHD